MASTNTLNEPQTQISFSKIQTENQIKNMEQSKTDIFIEKAKKIKVNEKCKASIQQVGIIWNSGYVEILLDDNKDDSFDEINNFKIVNLLPIDEIEIAESSQCASMIQGSQMFMFY